MLAEPQETAEPAVLDQKIIDCLVELGDGLGEDLLAELTGLFLAETVVRIADMHAAVAHHDGAAVVRSAHQLAGASANLGAVGLAGLLAGLEYAALSGELTDGATRLGAIEVELARVRLALLDQARTA
jgi:HPt (histidine-containing phosphotransfer) domain-containing protein